MMWHGLVAFAVAFGGIFPRGPSFHPTNFAPSPLRPGGLRRKRVRGKRATQTDARGGEATLLAPGHRCEAEMEGGGG